MWERGGREMMNAVVEGQFDKQKTWMSMLPDVVDNIL